MHVYEVRPRKDHRGVDLISDALPFGRLWYGERNEVSNGVDSFGRCADKNKQQKEVNMHILVRHKVADFAKWKPGYDAHLSARQKAGLKEEHLFRNADDPNEVLVLFSVEDVDKAKAFTASDDLRQAMEKAGVRPLMMLSGIPCDKPNVYFLR